MPLGKNLHESILYHMVQLQEGLSDAFVVVDTCCPLRML